MGRRKIQRGAFTVPLTTVRARKCRPLRVRIPKKHRRVPIFENIFWGHFRKQPQLEESLPIKHAAPLQDAGVTARRPLDFTASRPVCRLTQVPKGRGAKRGELRGAARAGQGRASGAGGGFVDWALFDKPPPGRPAVCCMRTSARPWTHVV